MATSMKPGFFFNECQAEPKKNWLLHTAACSDELSFIATNTPPLLALEPKQK